MRMVWVHQLLLKQLGIRAAGHWQGCANDFSYSEAAPLNLTGVLLRCCCIAFGPTVTCPDRHLFRQ